MSLFPCQIDIEAMLINNGHFVATTGLMKAILMALYSSVCFRIIFGLGRFYLMRDPVGPSLLPADDGGGGGILKGHAACFQF